MPDKREEGRKSKLVKLQPHPGAQARFVANAGPRHVWSAKLGCYVHAELRGVKP